MGRRVARCTLGIPDQPPKTDRRNPILLVHGVESVIPIEHQVQTLRVTHAPEDE